MAPSSHGPYLDRFGQMQAFPDPAMSPFPEGHRSRRRSGHRHGWYVDAELDPTQGSGWCDSPYGRTVALDLAIFGMQLVLGLAYVVGSFVVTFAEGHLQPDHKPNGLLYVNATVTTVYMVLVVGIFVASAIYHCNSEPSLMSLQMYILVPIFTVGCGMAVLFTAAFYTFFALTDSQYVPFFFVVVGLMVVYELVGCGYYYYREWALNEAHGKRFGKKLNPYSGHVHRRGFYSSVSSVS